MLPIFHFVMRADFSPACFGSFWAALAACSVATILGSVGVIAFIGLAIWIRDIWFAAIAVFMLLNCWSGLQQARALLKIAKAATQETASACPPLPLRPSAGTVRKCRQCGQSFDTFQTGAACPACNARYDVTTCLDCRESRPMIEWATSSIAPAKL